MNLAEELRFDPSGLVPVILQDSDTLEVLILAFMDRDAVERTLSSGLVHLWSRSRGVPWLKGGTSGRLQRVVEIRPNCEMNSLLVLVRQALPGACHTGHATCYYRRLEDANLREIAAPVFEPGHVYTGANTPLDKLLGAYEWIREHELIPGSNTSRTLHGRQAPPLVRLREEWDELLGVLAGTHTHNCFCEDVRLEAYQVLYWTCLHQVRLGMGRASALSEAGLRGGHGSDRAPGDLLVGALAAAEPDLQLEGLWSALGAACRVGGVPPHEIVERDLAELREREYMLTYFSSVEHPRA